MPNANPRDRFFYPSLTLIIDSNSISLAGSIFLFFIYFSNLDSVGECEVFSPEPVDHNANFTSLSEVKKQSNGDDLVGYISTLFTEFTQAYIVFDFEECN